MWAQKRGRQESRAGLRPRRRVDITRRGEIAASDVLVRPCLNRLSASEHVGVIHLPIRRAEQEVVRADVRRPLQVFGENLFENLAKRNRSDAALRLW